MEHSPKSRETISRFEKLLVALVVGGIDFAVVGGLAIIFNGYPRLTLDADIKPGKWKNVNVNRDLRLVYLFACDSGKKAVQWEEHLAPARVVTYNRMSTVFDHAIWFAFTGPAQMQRIQ